MLQNQVTLRLHCRYTTLFRGRPQRGLVEEVWAPIFVELSGAYEEAV